MSKQKQATFKFTGAPPKPPKPERGPRPQTLAKLLEEALGKAKKCVK